MNIYIYIYICDNIYVLYKGYAEYTIRRIPRFMCVVAVRLSAWMHLLHAYAWHINTYGRTAARIFAVANVASRAVELGQQSWGYSSGTTFFA